MKINNQKWIRAPCFVVILLVVLFCAAPAFAVNVNGIWTLNKYVNYPTWTTLNITFASNSTAFTSITYESYSEAYEVPLVRYDREIAFYWRDGKVVFLKPEYQFLDFGGFGIDVNTTFYAWMDSNARRGYITPEDDAAGAIKDTMQDAADRLEGANDIWGELPHPTIPDGALDFTITQRFEYAHFMAFFTVLWQNNIFNQMAIIIGGFLLLSFLIFAGK